MTDAAALPFSCDMTAIAPEERPLHRAAIAGVFGATEAVEALSDGYAFRLAGGAAMLARAADFIDRERLCCPFFGFVLKLEPGGPLWLHLTGREGVKPFIRAEIGRALRVPWPGADRRSGTSDGVRLRPLAVDDLPAFLAYRNDPEVARFQSWTRYTEEEARAYLERCAAATRDVPGQWRQWAIEWTDPSGGAPVLAGDCGMRLDDDGRQAEIGFTLSRALQGRGIGAAAVRLLLEHAFGALGLHRVVAVTDARNAPAARLLERAGFRREGHLIQNVHFKGEWGDEFLFAILRDEWARDGVAAPPA